MNALMKHLIDDWQQLQVESQVAPDQVSCLLKTPRFRASSHVLFFVFADRSAEPVVVVKVPRLPGGSHFLDLEVNNLRAIQAARVGGFDSIPRVIRYEDWQGTRILIETVLPGGTMSPVVVRQDPERCIRSVTDWLTELNRRTLHWPRSTRKAVHQRFDPPLHHLETVLPREDRGLVEWTRALIQPLYDAILPSVFEHGDLSSPNILMDTNGSIGVVDWELARPQGLPCADLFFFLTYIAFARAQAQTTEAHVAAFHEAFFLPSAWAREEILAHANSLDLPTQFLPHLFLLSWTRYVSTLIKRLHDEDSKMTDGSHELFEWLRGNRYYAIWKHTLEHWDELDL